jgi:hypothetical protein
MLMGYSPGLGCPLQFLRSLSSCRSSPIRASQYSAASLSLWWARLSSCWEAGSLEHRCFVPPNPRMQSTGRTNPSSARALIADGDQRNVD